MSEQPLKPREPITLLPSYEHTSVIVAGKHSFTVRGHVSAMWMGAEGETWQRGHVTKEGTR